MLALQSILPDMSCGESARQGPPQISNKCSKAEIISKFYRRFDAENLARKPTAGRRCDNTFGKRRHQSIPFKRGKLRTPLGVQVTAFGMWAQVEQGQVAQGF